MAAQKVRGVVATTKGEPVGVETIVAPGDFVVLNWRAVCGQRRAWGQAAPVLRHPPCDTEDDPRGGLRTVAGALRRVVLLP